MTKNNSQPMQAPLAARMRPKLLADYVGQSHLLGPNRPIGEMIRTGALCSMVLWGPPGVGKTTLARLLAEQANQEFYALSAVLGGVKEIRHAVGLASELEAQGKKLLLFVDEVHRFNKAQQDAFLPHVEEGKFLFIGATTENPSFELNNALLSRVRTFVLKPLQDQELRTIADRALTDVTHGLGALKLSLSEEAMHGLIVRSEGDARRLLNLLSLAVDCFEPTEALPHLIGADIIREVSGQQLSRFDKGGDQFYEMISALHKSVRGSDPDAALYWLQRMLLGGCDPLYVARRVVRMASEDIGNADPRALQLSLNAWDVQQRLGSPEGELAIAQAVCYLAVAPKSNAVYSAYKQSKAFVQDQPNYDVPLHLRNAPTPLMSDLHYGASYHYAHDFPEGYVPGEHYFPDELTSNSFYQPVPRGLEKKIGDKMSKLSALDATSAWRRKSEKSSESG